MKKYINTLIFLVCAFSAFAQAPQKFNYQAVARNAQGTVLSNQNVKIRASILDGSANGTSQYSETHSVTTSQLGLFNLAIGGGTVVSGTFANVPWASGDKYLKIEMDATGGNNFSLVGTSQLLSVPYALNAGNGTQWENSGYGIHYDSLRVGIGGIPDYNVGHPVDSLIRLVINGDMVIGNKQYADGRINFGNSNHAIFRDDLNNLIINTTGNFGQPVDSGQGNVIILDGGTAADGIVSNKRYVGICTMTPKSRLHISEGDVYIDDISKGVIMKSPNGGCWRMTVSDSGQPVFTSITCP